MEKIISLIMAFISITGVINGFFLFFYLLFVYAKKNPADKYLAFLILFLTLRMAKSIISSIAPVPFIVIHIGLAAFACVGPALLFYIRKSFSPGLEFSFKEALHFIPAILVLACHFLPFSQNNPVWDLRYNLIMLHILIYQVISFIFLYKNVKKYSLLPYSKSWYNFIVIAVTLIWTAYGATWWLGIIPYLSGTFIFCLVLYMFIFLSVKKRQLNESFEKYRNSQLSKNESIELFKRLLSIMDQSKPYLENEITLSKLATLLDIKPHSLSQVINENMNLNFFDFINTYRINEIKKRLASPTYSKYTIASIAYDCGFNSISSFNSAFRKKEKISPSKFREKINQHS